MGHVHKVSPARIPGRAAVRGLVKVAEEVKEVPVPLDAMHTDGPLELSGHSNLRD